MKAADTRSTAVAARSNTAFFSKEAGQSFFNSSQPDTDFFSKSSIAGNNVQRKSTGNNLNIVSAKNNIITPIQAKCTECEEKEKLNRKEDADGEELDMQRKPFNDNPPSILKLGDEKSKEEEKIQHKEETKEDEKDKLLKKPDNIPDLQSKCAECEGKEEVNKKEEPKEEEDQDKLQKQETRDSVPQLQEKCDKCEEEKEQVQQKQEDKEDEKEELQMQTNGAEEEKLGQKKESQIEEKEKIQEKPAELITPISPVQLKCDTCQAEELTEEKKELKEEETDGLQRKVTPELANGQPESKNNLSLAVIQAKLSIGKPGDKYERQADAVADQTVQKIQRSPVNQAGGKIEEKEKEKDEIMAEPMPEFLQMSMAGAPSDNSGNGTGNGDDHTKNNSLNFYSAVQRRCRECEEGDVIFRKASPDLQRAGSNDVKADGSRESIVALAKSQVGKVEAKTNEGGKRKGADRLLEYFNIAAPGVWPDQVIETAGAQMPSWCGIFSVWAHKKAGKDIGTWQMGRGVSAFNTLTQTTDPQPGDIGYIDRPYQHHCIIVKKEGNTIHSIDGNSGLFSEVKENTRTLSDYTGFFTAFGSGSSSVQRKEEGIQEKPGNAEKDVSSDIEGRLKSSKGSGETLPEPVRANMESAMGADFSDVKIHTGSDAVGMSRDLHAQAFTHGSDIYFNAGKYDTNSSKGQHLLSHELTHTVQQGAAVQKRDITQINREEEEKPNFDFTYLFRNEIVFLGFKLKDATLSKVKSNPDAIKLIKSALDKVLHFAPNHPVYETPTFLKSNVVRNLITTDLDLWPGTGEPLLPQLNALITKRMNVLVATVIVEAVDNHLMAINIDPAFIDWKILIPQLKANMLTWTAKNAIEASEHDQYEWVLDLMADEAAGLDPVQGAKAHDAAVINGHLYPFVLHNNELFSDEVIQAHSEKFVMPWLVKIDEVQFVPDKFSLTVFEPGEEVRKAERGRERLLSEFIRNDVPDLMFKYILDTWTGAGVNVDLWLKNLDIDSYKGALLDHLAGEFIKKAKQDPDYMQSLRLEALEKTKYRIITMFFGAAKKMQSTNDGLEARFRKGFKDDLEPDMVAIIENPAQYYDLSVKVASATMKFLTTLQPDRSLSNDNLVAVFDILNAMQVPPKLSALATFIITVGGYLKDFKATVDSEQAKVKDAIKDRIKVDYDSIAKVVKQWKTAAEDFMKNKFKPMLKTVALEMLAANKIEIENILANYDSASAKFAAQMNESANELQYAADGLESGDYEEVEYEGEVVTKDDLPQMRDTIQFMRDEANARIDSKKSKEEKGKLKEALEEYDQVKKDIKSDEYEWLDYAKEVFVEARRRLGISEFPEFTTYSDVFSGRVVAEKNPFLAMVIQNYYFVEDQERKMWEAFKIVGLGILTIAAAVIPGVGGLILGAIDIAIGLGMGVKGVVDAKEVLRMAKLDISGTIRGVSVEQAEKALKHAWFGLIFTVALTAGPVVISRALKIRGAGGVKLSGETRAWERTLSPSTREALKRNPALRKLYAEMDDAVRRILTLCESDCIPLGFGPSKAEITRIDSFIKQIKVPPNHRGLREYFHHPARRNNLTQAMDDLKGVKDIGQLEKRLDRAIAANVKQVGASSNKVNGVWHYTRPDGTVVKEYEIASHGNLTANRGTSRFFQSHHGIQDAWAMEKNIPGYTRDACPAILLRDSKMGTPHQIISARQTARYDTIGSRTYAMERDMLKADMKAAGVDKASANKILQESDSYFGGLYRGIEAKGNKAELIRIFGKWKP